MKWTAGLILRIKDYKFEDDGSARDKYSIVLYANEEEAYLIHSLTTTQNPLGVSGQQYGCSIHKNIVPYFFIPANKEIGDNKFYFDKDTFIFFRQNVRKELIAKFELAAKSLWGIVELGILTNEELKRILKCVLKSKFLEPAISKILTEFKDTL